ncbi:MAG: hypothetical protein HY709_06035 [Candidatus Latescibacteria bacterium]|nr:hypothetical protein [Candidatus Latescibacterota bacterium]
MKTYTTDDLWALIDRAYYGYVRHFWDPFNHYYVGENGHASSGTNCSMSTVHVLRHLHQPHHENVDRVHHIVEHILASHDTYGTGGLLNTFDDPGQGGAMRAWLGSGVLIASALILKHSNLLEISDVLRERIEFTFYRYFALADALVESWDRRDNQTVAAYFLTLAYAYWGTGDVRFLDRARWLTEALSGIYTTDEPLSIRNIHRGCFPDWTWWYAQAMDYRETGGASHTAVYQNAHFYCFAFGHRLFRLTGVTEFPWLDFIRQISRISLFNNIAANGLSPYVIETYQLQERYNPMSQINITGPAAWMQTSPETLHDPEWAGRARFLFDRGIETFERFSDTDGALPKSLYSLNDRVGAYSPGKYDNNVVWLHMLSQVATFADLDTVRPVMRRYWDWRWFWDLVHVRGDCYDAYLAGWTNKRREDWGAHQRYARAGHPPNSWVDPLYVGGSIARLFTVGGAIVFPLCINKFGWRVETDRGTYDSTEACMGRKGEGYEFWIEVDGERLTPPEDYGEITFPLDFDRIVCHWRVVYDSAGEMVIENTFLPDRIEVENRFVPLQRVHVLRIAQAFPYTRASCDRIAYKRAGAIEEIYAIDWRAMFTPACRKIDLAEVEYVAIVLRDEASGRVIITPERRSGNLWPSRPERRCTARLW